MSELLNSGTLSVLQSPAMSSYLSGAAKSEDGKTFYLAGDIAGKWVRTPKGDVVGEIVDILLDQHGLMVGLVVDVTEYLRRGPRYVLLNWNSLHFQRDKDQMEITTRVDKKTLGAQAPIEWQALTTPQSGNNLAARI